MLNSWVISLVIAFVVRQISKYGKEIDWAKVKADAEIRIRALIPGEWFDDEAVMLVNAIIDRAAEVMLNAAAIEKIMTLAANGKWAEAFAELKKLLVDGWVSVPAKVRNAVANAK